MKSLLSIFLVLFFYSVSANADSHSTTKKNNFFFGMDIGISAKHVMNYEFACSGCYKDILVKNSERKNIAIALGYDRTFKKNYSIGIEYKFINKDAVNLILFT